LTKIFIDIHFTMAKANKKKKGKQKANNKATEPTSKPKINYAELLVDDEALFSEDVPPREECPICLLPFLCAVSTTKYQECCGKLICTGCYMIGIEKLKQEKIDKLRTQIALGKKVKDKDKEIALCPFCRKREPTSNAEAIKWMEKRMEMNDPVAFHRLASFYRNGEMDLQKDGYKAMELLHKAAELGSIGAHQNLGYAYNLGEYCEKDLAKSIYHYQVAALGGVSIARYNLGSYEVEAGNIQRGMKHFIISAMAGHDMSLDMIKKGYTTGDVTKEDFARALRAHKEAVDEMKSAERDKVTVSGKHREKWKVRNADQKLQFRGALRQATAVDAVDPTPYVVLKNMVIDDLKNDRVYQNLLAETHNECSKFGNVKMLIIPRCGPGAGSIFIEYETAGEGGKIVASLGGIVRRKGGGIEAEYCDPACLSMNNYFMSIQVYETQEAAAHMWEGM